VSEILQLQSVSRRFGGLQALRDVSLTVNRGEVIGLIGPSRIYLGHHWLTDVLASYLLGLAYFSGMIAVYRWLRSLLDGEPEPEYYGEPPEQPSILAPLPILGEG